MYQAKTLLQNLNEEATITRKFLELVPVDKFDWKPHPKSMSLKALATHVAEIPGWTHMAITTSELDLQSVAGSEYAYPPIESREDILAFFEKSLKKSQEVMETATDEDLQPIWTLRNGDQVWVNSPKGEMIRGSLNQSIHHRAQLGVYLRLLDIPIPGSYGPSADELGL